MSVSGDPELWSDLVPDRFIPQIIALVLEGWETFEKPAKDDLEVPITMRFCCCLRGHKNQRRLPFTIWYELVELNAQSGSQLGRIDRVQAVERRGPRGKASLPRHGIRAGGDDAFRRGEVRQGAG